MNVISASSPLKAGASDGRVRDWLRERSNRLFLSAVSLAEVRAGVEKARRNGHSRKADQLDRWLGGLAAFYGPRTLPLDTAIADCSGVLFDRAIGTGKSPDWIDAQIAATAAVHDLTLLTRNIRHFEPFGTEILDPFADGFDAS